MRNFKFSYMANSELHIALFKDPARMAAMTFAQCVIAKGK